MKESHAEVSKEELGKIVYQKNKEIGELFNQKNELQQEMDCLKEEQELNQMVKEENQQLKDRLLQIMREKEALQSTLDQSTQSAEDI